MKKFSLSILLFAFAVILVGCGSQNTTSSWDNTEVAPTPSENSAEDMDDDAGEEVAVVVENEGEVQVDVAYTTKLANCMTENGTKMYGTERCGHCATQKGLFGDAFANIDYTDCDEDRQACLDAGVRGFPTWIDNEGNPYPGTQTLDRLAAISGCQEI